jgi:hypothetical protein
MKVDSFSWFGHKTGGYNSCGLTSKSLAQVFQFEAQNRQLRFSDLAHKTTTTVYWFVRQNQVGYGWSVAPQNRWEDADGTRHALRSSCLVHLEVS